MSKEYETKLADFIACKYGYTTIREDMKNTSLDANIEILNLCYYEACILAGYVKNVDGKLVSEAEAKYPFKAWYTEMVMELMMLEAGVH